MLKMTLCSLLHMLKCGINLFTSSLNFLVRGGEVENDFLGVGGIYKKHKIKDEVEKEWW